MARPPPIYLRITPAIITLTPTIQYSDPRLQTSISFIQLLGVSFEPKYSELPEEMDKKSADTVENNNVSDTLEISTHNMVDLTIYLLTQLDTQQILLNLYHQKDSTYMTI